MASGSAPGAGKSTLIDAVAAELRRLGDTVDVVTEDDVWGERRLDELGVDLTTARPEFVELLLGGRRPTSDAVIATFEVVASNIRARWWLQDWTWQELDALSDPTEGRSAADGLDAGLAQHDALLLYLRVDPVEALSRAVTQRGTTWLSRHARDLGLRSAASVEEVAEVHAQREEGRLARISASACRQVVLNGARAPHAVVSDAVRTVRGR